MGMINNKMGDTEVDAMMEGDTLVEVEAMTVEDTRVEAEAMTEEGVMMEVAIAEGEAVMGVEEIEKIKMESFKK